MGNVLTDLPKSMHSKAKAALQAIWMAATRTEANQAFKRFIVSFRQACMNSAGWSGNVGAPRSG
jgi:hypothetical protein